MFDLKRFRNDKKLGQKDIALVLKVGQAFISQVERGIDPMPDGWIKILKEIYQIENIEQYIIEDKLSDSGAMENCLKIIERLLKEQRDEINILRERIAVLEDKATRLGGECRSQNPGKRSAALPETG